MLTHYEYLQYIQQLILSSCILYIHIYIYMRILTKTVYLETRSENSEGQFQGPAKGQKGFLTLSNEMT